MRIRTFAALVGVSLCTCAFGQEGLNLLFYGNSFTQGIESTRDVPGLVRDIAVAAGQPAPNIVSAAIAGAALWVHLQSNTAVISTRLAPDEHWDHVILQDASTQPTRLGDLAVHRSSSMSLFQLVRAHSPGVHAIGFETWARGPGHSFYLPPWPEFPGGPAQMQQEVRDGYALSTADVNEVCGAGTSTVAPVGDAWERAGWVNLHAGDLWHAQNRGTLLAALVIYATIYHDATVSDIDITLVLDSLNLSVFDGAFLTAAADRTIGCPAEFNHDGVVNPDDLADFITCFFLEVQVPGTCGDADFNLDESMNPDDLADFITAFFAAC